MRTAARPARPRAARRALAGACLGVALAAPCLASSAAAQSRASARPKPAVVRGVAFDSLTGRPLVGALVVVEGTATAAVADSAGRFAITGVVPGRQLLTAEHPSLDTLGLSALTLAVEVGGDGASGVVLATPSRAAVWRRACGGDAPPTGGVLFGDVRDAGTGARLAGARAEVTWSAGGSAGTGEPRTRAVVTDSVGAYRVCGVPTDAPLTVRASAGTDVGEAVPVQFAGRPLTRANLVVARAHAGGGR